MSQAEGEQGIEGVINIGKGFALMSIGEFKAAHLSLKRALELCGDNEAQAAFVSDLVRKVILKMFSDQDKGK